MIRYTQSGGVGGIWATDYLQLAAAQTDTDGWVYLAEERDASLMGGGHTQYDLLNLGGNPALTNTWILADLSAVVAPWATRTKLTISLDNNDASEEDTILWFRPYHSTGGLASSRFERARLRADVGINSEILWRGDLDVSCVGGKFFVYTPSADNVDSINLRARAFR